MKKILWLSLAAIGCFAGGGQTIYAAQDSAALMPDISEKQIAVGYYHNWVPEQGAGYRGGKPAETDLGKINPFYNVIAVSFMKGEGIPTFEPFNMSDEEFRSKVAALNEEGRSVIISLGGADSHIELYRGQEQAFADEVIRLVETYGFDGLDIDLEQSAITAGDNQQVIPEALKIVRDHYKKQGKHFIISMAPEFPYLRTAGGYVPYITALENEYDFIAPQLYNQAGDGLSVGDEWIAQNNDSRKYDFLYGMSKALHNGESGYIRIPADRLALGIPANNDAAANSYVQDPSVVYQVFEQMEKERTPLKGLMTWSVNWDEGVNSAGISYNESFAKAYQNLFKEQEPDTEKPSKPTNLRGTATSTTVTLSWTESTDNVRVSHYNIYENNRLVGTSNTTNYIHTGLQPETTYSYTIEAVDTSGNISARSDDLNIRTQEAAVLPAPSIPNGLSINHVTQSTVRLVWQENSLLEEVLYYEIYRDGKKIATSQTAVFEDQNLTASTAYRYQVRAVNQTGASLLSQSVTARTLDENGQGNSWTVGTFYQVGDIVTYNGIQYRCVQAHIAAAHWAPDTAFSLWQKIS